MQSNWRKAIQYTAAMLAANIVGALLTFALDMLWPMVVVVIGCSVICGYFILGNAICEWRLNRLEREPRT